VFNAAPLPKPSQGAWRAPSLSHIFSNSYTESSESHVSAAFQVKFEEKRWSFSFWSKKIGGALKISL